MTSVRAPFDHHGSGHNHDHTPDAKPPSHLARVEEERRQKALAEAIMTLNHGHDESRDDHHPRDRLLFPLLG